MSKNIKCGVLIAVACAVLATALIAMSNSAATRDINLTDMVTAKGECRMELVKGAGYNPCNEGVIYMLFKNGRHLLTFSNKGDIVISVSGAGDRQPRLEDYYLKIDTLRINIPGRKEAVDTNMEGECHIRITKEKGDFRQIECDVYDRAKGLSFSARVDNIVDSTHRHFD
jgi:archaellum component FlaG (FlaF/FlaG flagellin family)